MSTTKIILLEKAVNNIAVDASYYSRCTTVSSIERGFLVQYQVYDNIKITKSNIARAIGITNPSINHQSVKHNSDFYHSIYCFKQFHV